MQDFLEFASRFIDLKETIIIIIIGFIYILISFALWLIDKKAKKLTS